MPTETYCRKEKAVQLLRWHVLSLRQRRQRIHHEQRALQRNDVLLDAEQQRLELVDARWPPNLDTATIRMGITVLGRELTTMRCR